ncbi:uncharacterized conserved protein [Anaerolinea thermolimosa]|uniref:DUF488 domain-containing protein n=1 Tax=Anaerolinea thermolimosa TaxID=229919 RepID=UPI00078408CD|nr:DUF488 family protein [Anaerolinea thermolimosa]GAP06449.1 uncharacterized conserved protein [Anaerolinea thermolimosa]
MALKIKRIYEPAEIGDGRRFFVERLWPRGFKKEAAKIEAWLKEVAPSTELRRWYAHDLARWEEFTQRYRAELEACPSAWQFLLEAAEKGDVTLLYSARDIEHNSALVLRDFLMHNLEIRAGNRGD